MSKKIRKTTADVQTSDTTLDTGAQEDVTYYGEKPSLNGAQRWLRDNFEKTTYVDDNPELKERVIRGVGYLQASLGVNAGIFERLDKMPPLPDEIRKGWKWDPDSPEDYERVTEVMGALKSFFGTEAAAVLLGRGGEWIPDGVYTDPVLGFEPGASWEKHRAEHERQYPGRPIPTTKTYKCGFTGRRFDLPVGAPVPTVYFSMAYYDDTECSDEWAETVHPLIFAEGKEAVYRAIWGFVVKEIDDTFQQLAALLLFAGCVSTCGPENFTLAPERAYRVESSEGKTRYWGWTEPKAA